MPFGRIGSNFRSPPPVAIPSKLQKINEKLLAIEVSDSTLGFDLNRKARLYARSGVGEYWVLDIRGRRILAHRQHLGEKYEVIKPFKDGDPITLEGRSETIAVSDLLPPVSTAPNAPDTAQ